MYSSMNESIGMSASDKASHSSENTLELLNKVDQSKEHSAVMNCTSTGYISVPQNPESESSNGTGGCLQQNQSSPLKALAYSWLLHHRLSQLFGPFFFKHFSDR